MDGLYRWDMATFRALNLGFRSPLLDFLFLIVSQSGLGGLQAFAVILLYRWPRARRFIVPCVAAIAVSGLVFSALIKQYVKRDRPSNLRFAIPQEHVHSASFVSGHTTTSFALATMLVLMTIGTRRWWIGALAMVWAFGVGVSRVYRGVHWPSDVVAGALLGAFAAGLVFLAFERRGWLNLTLENLSFRRKRV